MGRLVCGPPHALEPQQLQRIQHDDNRAADDARAAYRDDHSCIRQHWRIVHTTTPIVVTLSIKSVRKSVRPVYYAITAKDVNPFGMAAAQLETRLGSL